MRPSMGRVISWPAANVQEAGHHAGFDYERGSPHLSHARLRAALIGEIRGLVAHQFRANGRCRVLEIGAGHGAFTDHVAAMGAEVTVTEMSRPSLDVLRARFAHNSRVSLIFDNDGEAAASIGNTFDLVLCVSVLHHIPDYEAFVRRVTDSLAPGGAFASFQDPLWYPRRPKWGVQLEKSMYYIWRVRQGEIRRGISTRLRRARGVYDEENPADMIEYHVVRQGVDERALAAILRERFAEVALRTYFSTQGTWLQRVGEKLGHPTTFALIATDRQAAPILGQGARSGGLA
jgi:SAM-dependent methyltransferase